MLGLTPSRMQEAAEIAAAKDRLQRRMEDDPRVTTMRRGDSFLWGAGGTRMTPDEITSRRRLVDQRAAAGMDTSPVGSWTQGLARVAQALVANLEGRRLDRAAEANGAQSANIARLLVSGATPADAAFAAANPFLDDATRKFATGQYERLTPKPQQPSDLQQRVEYLDSFKPGLGGEYATNYAANGGGAPQIVTTPQGTFMVPRGPAASASPAPAVVPEGAVAYLRSNPATADQFDAKFGQGASARYLQGGAAPQAPAPFSTR